MRMFTVLAPRKPPLISARGKPRSGGRVQPTAQAVGKQRPVGQAPKGRKKETSVKDKLWPVENIDDPNPLGNREAIFLRPSGASSLFLVASHGLRRGLHSFAPSEQGCLPYPELGRWRGRSSDSRFGLSVRHL